MPAQSRDVVVVGASAGGVEALRSLVGSLPEDLPAAVLVVLHLPAGGTSALPTILDRSGPLPAVSVRTAVRLCPGTVYVAPPDHHLLVVDGEAVLSHGPTENGHRPAVNALFRSAAIAAGPRVIGVVLSGTLDDGVAGLRAIGTGGGIKLVQEPADCLHPGMPENALRYAQPNQVATAAELGKAIGELSRERIDGLRASPLPASVVLENRIARYGGKERIPGGYDPRELGEPAVLSCPDCHGPLVETEPDSAGYRCRVGHGWSAQALLEAQGDTFERALWTALRTLDDKVSLAARMSSDAARRGHERLRNRYALVAEESQEAANVLRRHLVSPNPAGSADDKAL
jgi:two-component system chemotaxis response regulator CheB